MIGSAACGVARAALYLIEGMGYLEFQRVGTGPELLLIQFVKRDFHYQNRYRGRGGRRKQQ